MTRHRARYAIVLALLVAGASAGAQSRIGLAAGDGVPLRVARGAPVAIPMTIDMSAAGGANLAALSAAMLWDASVLTFDSVKAGAFGSITANTAGAIAGVVPITSYATTGITTSTSFATFFFTATSGAGGTRVRPLAYTAGDELGASILGLMRPRALDVCVADAGYWGDANGDGSVNIIDAQQIARNSVGLSIVSLSALRGRGDVNEDGAVDIIDAQQIARFSVDFPSVPRINTATLVTPDVGSVTTPSATASIQVGRSMELNASALDTDGNDLKGCAPITWSSSDSTKARVDQDGVVIGLAAGVPVISATSGGVTTRIALNVGLGATPKTMTVVQGDGQFRADKSYAVKPQVRVVDSLNRAVPGVSVLFTANTGGLVTSTSGVQRSSITAVTDSSGIAEIGGWSGGGTPVPGQTTYDGYVLQSVERVTATVPGLAPLTITGIAVDGASGVSPSICLMTLAGAAYCHGEYPSDALERADSTLGSVPLLIEDGVAMATLSPGFDGMFSCGVARTGDGYCWGWNHAGQLGDGTQNRSRGMRRVAGGLSFVKIATGYNHACGITTRGRGYCWGLNQDGQLGTGSLGGISDVPAAVSGTDQMLDIATGYDATCGATTGGDTWCWGKAPFVDSTGARVAVPRRITGAPAFTKLALGQTVACGVTSAGQVNCWGTSGPALGDGSTANRYASFSTVVLPAPARDIWGTFDAFCASTTDGALYCWGKNSYGQIGGVGDGAPHATPALVGFVNAVRGQMQPFGFCYQDATNQPFCFGSFAIGDGTPVYTDRNLPRFAPVPVKWVEGSAGVAAAMTIADGAGQSAVAGAAVAIAPAVLVRDNSGSPVVGATVTFAVSKGGGTLTGNVATTNASGVATLGSWTLGSLGVNEITATTGIVTATIRASATVAPSLLQVISGDEQTQIGNSNSYTGSAPFLSPVKVEVYDASERPVPNVAVTFSIVSGGGDFYGKSSVRVQTDSLGIATVVWGAGLPNGLQTATASVPGLDPVSFRGTSTSGISSLSKCALGALGRAYCWGLNSHGEVGDGTFTLRIVPTAVGGGVSFTKLASDRSDHVCGITTSGQLYCWGANNFGQLGDGSGVDQTTPVLAGNGATYTDVAVSTAATCAIRVDSKLVCWGWASYDLFDDNRVGVIHVPTEMGSYEYTPARIFLGPSNACVLDNGNRRHCWGLGTSGQLGDGQYTSRTRPSSVPSDYASYATVAIGDHHMCGLTTAGTVTCWGANESGQLGNGGFASTATPTPLSSDKRFTSIDASGLRYSCATASDGAAWCWGRNGSSSPLGDGGTANEPVPVRVAGDMKLQSLTVGYGSACGFAASGQPYCWGSNYDGLLGTGSFTASLFAVAARWPEGTTGIPVSLAINAGDNQTGYVGEAIGTAPSVIVKDYAGTPLVGTTVTFTVTSGGGSVTTATATTNALGIATVDQWILGPAMSTNTLMVTAPGLPTVVITANGIPRTDD